MTIRALLVRGLLVGVLAGILALGFGELFGEPNIDRAVTFEKVERLAHGEPPERELVSRDLQKTAGIATAMVVYGAALGGLFALAFAVAYQRIGRFSPRVTAALLAAGGYLVLFVVPFIKYPANPPSVGYTDTIGKRTALYVAMLATSLLIALVAVRLGRQLRARVGDWNAALIGGGVFVLGVALIQLLLPPINEVPQGFPASTLWQFRLASLGTQLVLWATLGLAFGALTERSVSPRPRRPLRPAREPA